MHMCSPLLRAVPLQMGIFIWRERFAVRYLYRGTDNTMQTVYNTGENPVRELSPEYIALEGYNHYG